MATTSYSINLEGSTVETKSKKDRAIAIAEALRGDNPTAEITVVTQSGQVVHTVKVKGTHAKPWTRTETHEGIEVEVPAGYTVAYTRKRVGAVVARADDKSGYLVITEAGQSLEAENTAKAREITNQLAADHAEAVALQREADKVAKAEAKAKRDQERADAKAAKEAEREAKAAQKKAEKEAKAAAEAAEAEAAEGSDEDVLEPVEA